MSTGVGGMELSPKGEAYSQSGGDLEELLGSSQSGGRGQASDSWDWKPTRLAR